MPTYQLDSKPKCMLQSALIQSNLVFPPTSSSMFHFCCFLYVFLLSQEIGRSGYSRQLDISKKPKEIFIPKFEFRRSDLIPRDFKYSRTKQMHKYHCCWAWKCIKKVVRQWIPSHHYPYLSQITMLCGSTVSRGMLAE